MRKLSTILLLALLVSPLLNASAKDFGPNPEPPELVTVCYFGVTLTVSPKAAARYIKLGATPGACGETEPEECPPGTIEIIPGLCFPIGPFEQTSTVEKPIDLRKSIQLDQPTDATTKVLWSVETEKLAAK